MESLEIKLHSIAERDKIPVQVATVVLHANDYHRNLGGKGLKFLSADPIKVLGARNPDRYLITLSLVPRIDDDNPEFLRKTQDYTNSSAFKDWLKSEFV